MTLGLSYFIELTTVLLERLSVDYRDDVEGDAVTLYWNLKILHLSMHQDGTSIIMTVATSRGDVGLQANPALPRVKTERK